MTKSNKKEAPKKSNKTKGVKAFFATILIALVTISGAYCVFVTVVLADGKQNIILATPLGLAIAGILVVGLYKAVHSSIK